MDSARIAPERISRLRRWWRLFTVPADKRCTRCLRRADGWSTVETEKRGKLTFTTERRYCEECFNIVTADWSVDG